MAEVRDQEMTRPLVVDAENENSTVSKGVVVDFGSRVTVQGKFLQSCGEKLYVRGVTYGPFAPDEDGCEYGAPDRVAADFRQMAEAGINSVRLYTAPPRWVLDTAARNGLHVLVGLPWEQHVAFLDDPHRAEEIVERVREAVRQCAHHPAVFCFAVGNEIPASIVRWHGKKAIERFIRRLYLVAKEEAPDTLVTYVNYPSTEYLDLSFVDFHCFNVYLEKRGQLEAYLARLQNLAEDKPLLLAEVGLDSQRNGEKQQADVLRWQIESAFCAGLAGLFLFAWTDEWYRGGNEIEDWSFGLVSRDRTPKLALEAVRAAFDAVPFPKEIAWPEVSVLVCTHNGAATIRQCLEGIAKLDYPNYEVVVVSDGSTDDTTSIAEAFEVRLVTLEQNYGLSHARNVAAREARGEIVAYIDDDAYPDPHWLKYLVHTFNTTSHAGVGGPNIPPPGAGWIADCVANAPGGPTHVLLTDEVAEHIPGCNMAYRRDKLLEVGGFDDTFWIAGDDVDLCWRIQSAGYTLGYSAAALVWHHRRNSVRAYLRQQRNYGRAEAMLERKWPNKYNALGHVPWLGRIYGREVHRHFLPGRSRIYQGTWGLAPFQRIYEPTTDLLGAVVRMPEWYLAAAGFAFLCVLGMFWRPLLFAAPLLAVTVGLPVLHAVLCARDARFDPTAEGSPWKKRALTALLTFLQPVVRLRGRVERGLTPWRTRGTDYPVMPVQRNYTLWYEQWQAYDVHLRRLYDTLRARGAAVYRGGDFDRRDIMVRGGLFGAVAVLMGVEEHGNGKQFVRFKVKPRLRRHAFYGSSVFGVLGIAALASGSTTAFVALAIVSAALVLRAGYECGIAMSSVHEVMLNDKHLVKDVPPQPDV